MPFAVYTITHVQTNRHYVGKSGSVKRRWARHLAIAAGRVARAKQHIHHALAQYGADAFKFQVLEEFETEADAYDAEAWWVAFLRSNVEGYGFNLNEGGQGGWLQSQESRAKISARKKGWKMSDAQRALISANSKRPHGPMSDETKAKISAANTGRRWTEERRARVAGRPGRKLSQEEIANLRACNLGKKRPPEVGAAISAAKLGKKYGPQTPEQRARTSAALVGHHVSDETRAKLSAARRRTVEAKRLKFLEEDVQ